VRWEWGHSEKIDPNVACVGEGAIDGGSASHSKLTNSVICGQHFQRIVHIWRFLVGHLDSVYVVQTNIKLVRRLVVMVATMCGDAPGSVCPKHFTCAERKSGCPESHR
jgi:hypothetical protein